MKKRLASAFLCLCMLLPLIPAALAKMPDDKLSVEEYEWEVLRLVNVERAKAGLNALGMVSALQDSARLRVKELDSLFSHTRPDGSGWSTAVDSGFATGRGMGENIAMGHKTPDEVVQNWMTSSGHKANILNPNWAYLGVGYALVSGKPCWVQNFADGDALAEVTASTDKTSFASRSAFAAEYLATRDSAGITAYVPLDVNSAKESGGNYTPRLDFAGLPSFQVSSDARDYAGDSAADRNKAVALQTIEDMKINNDINPNILIQIIMQGYIDASGGNWADMGVCTNSFKVTRATAAKAGLMTAQVRVSLDGVVSTFDVEKVIPVLGDKYVPSTPAQANKKIQEVIDGLTITNTTKEADVMAAIKDAVDVDPWVEMCNFTKASVSDPGSMLLVLVIDGTAFKYVKEIPTVSAKASVTETVGTLGKILDGVEAGNKSAAADFFTPAQNAKANASVKIVWAENFALKKATETDPGLITGALKVTCAGESATVRINRIIEPLGGGSATVTGSTKPPVIVSTGLDPAAKGTAYPATQAVNVDGKGVTFQMYALRDDKGGITNYIKLRDLADILDGTKAQFNVGWDGNINLEKNKAYTSRNGSENKSAFTGEQSYIKCASTTNVNGAAVDLRAFTLTDANGGAHNYFKLRDLGQALGFNVGWSADKGVFVETDQPYHTNG